MGLSKMQSGEQAGAEGFTGGVSLRRECFDGTATGASRARVIRCPGSM